MKIEDIVVDNADVEERVATAGDNAKRAANRAFWQQFIESVRFDHPDQASPRHGGNNWFAS